jgi:hypothetical protein
MDSLAKPFFVLVYFCVLHCSSKVFFSYLFPSLATYIHIFGPVHVVFLVFNHFVSLLAFVGLFVHPHKCSTWASSSLPLGLFPLSNYIAPFDGIKIHDIPFRSIFVAFFFL